MLKELIPRTWTAIVAASVLASIAAIAWTEWKEKTSAVEQLRLSEKEVKRIQSELDERVRVALVIFFCRRWLLTFKPSLHC